MLLRVTQWAHATFCLMLLGPGASLSAPAPHFGTRIGIFIGGHPNFITLGHALGVRYERLIMAVDGPNSRALANIKGAESAGFRLNIQFTNLLPSTTGRPRPGPVTDDATFERALGADLDAAHPGLVTIQNEEDIPKFWSGTPQDYLHELTDAVRVAHVRGYEISNGGISTGGVMLAYWHHLWESGQYAAADAFAQRNLGPPGLSPHLIARDLPNAAYPNRPLLALNPVVRDKLARAETLIAGYRATGIDYVNFHWYEGGPDDLQAVATWLSRTTGLPAICNEMGQYSNDPRTVTGLLDMSESLHLAWVLWFAIDGKGPAVGLADPDTAVLRANGQAFRAFVTSHP